MAINNTIANKEFFFVLFQSEDFSFIRFFA